MKPKLLAIPMMMMIASAVAAPAPEAPVKLSFDLLKKTVIQEAAGEGAEADKNRKTIYPEDLRKLEGKHVVITGFLAPYDDPDKMTKMMIFQTVVGCFYCNPPAETETVFVRMSAKEKPLRMNSDTVRVEGILHLNHPDTKDEEIKQFCFTIDEAKITPAAGG